MKTKLTALLALCLVFTFTANAYALSIDVSPISQTIELGRRAYWRIFVTDQKEFYNRRADGSSAGWLGAPDGEYEDFHTYQYTSTFLGYGEAYNGSLRVQDRWTCKVIQ